MKTSKHTKTTSVYRNQNVLIHAVFQRAGDTRKVLCVALDYAKRKHVTLICDGNGDILKAAFPVENNPAGIDFLIKEVSATARRRKISKNQIFFGGEDEAAISVKQNAPSLPHLTPSEFPQPQENHLTNKAPPN
jgi:hypothetical protein